VASNGRLILREAGRESRGEKTEATWVRKDVPWSLPKENQVNVPSVPLFPVPVFPRISVLDFIGRRQPELFHQFLDFLGSRSAFRFGSLVVLFDIQVFVVIIVVVVAVS
jgi:hypothetical protein